MIKAILLDIDGTLTNSKKEITPKTKEALLKAQKAGIKLAVVSARTENGLARFGRWLDFEQNHGILIACNGALIKDMETGEVFFDKSMSKELGAAILEHLKKFNVIPLVAKGEYMYTNDVFSGMIQVRGKDGSYHGRAVPSHRRGPGSLSTLLHAARFLGRAVSRPGRRILAACGSQSAAQSDNSRRILQDSGFSANITAAYRHWKAASEMLVGLASRKLQQYPRQPITFIRLVENSVYLPCNMLVTRGRALNIEY